MPAYILSPEARKNLISIRTYTKKKWGMQQAKNYIKALEQCFDKIAKNPQLGRERPEIRPGYRSIAEGKHVIFYRVCDAGVEILGIPHGSMDIEYRLNHPKIKPREG